MSNLPRLAGKFLVNRWLGFGLVAVATASFATGISGCGGGSSERPTFTQASGYTGSYTASVNRSTSGNAVNATLPSGTVTLTASTDNTLTASLVLTDTTRAASSRAVTTYGTISGTYDSSGAFDFTGRPREVNTQTGAISVGVQTARLQGQLPSGAASTTITVQVGSKTATGSLTLASSGTPTPSPSPTANNSVPAPPGS